MWKSAQRRSVARRFRCFLLWTNSKSSQTVHNTKGTRAHTHRELIREWLWEPKGSSLDFTRNTQHPHTAFNPRAVTLNLIETVLVCGRKRMVNRGEENYCHYYVRSLLGSHPGVGGGTHRLRATFDRC